MEPPPVTSITSNKFEKLLIVNIDSRVYRAKKVPELVED
jgi:hypothetical protein